MFIKNSECIHKKIMCSPMFAQMLKEKYGFPVLGFQDNKILFSDTDELRKVLSDMPIWTKLQWKEGG